MQQAWPRQSWARTLPSPPLPPPQDLFFKDLGDGASAIIAGSFSAPGSAGSEKQLAFVGGNCSVQVGGRGRGGALPLRAPALLQGWW